MRFSVGPGVSALMLQQGDEPATDELYHPIGALPGQFQYSETFAQSGLRYVYIRSKNKTVVYSPSPAGGVGVGSATAPRIIQSLTNNFNGLRRAPTLGCVMHSTNGGGTTPDNEFNGTLAWFKNPASQVSSHIVIHADGTIAEVVEPANRAWHAGELNDSYLGIELASAADNQHITDEQLRSAAWWLKRQSARFEFPLTSSTLPEHRQTSQGRAIGKSDIGKDYTYARLKRFLDA